MGEMDSPGDSGPNTSVQEWPDGCKYEGEFRKKLKHGAGVFTWRNGESYKGLFFKDFRHGSGTYSWPDSSKFTGKFYLNRKEGYGVQDFADGSTFKGLYHADERFGPGVQTYAEGGQDVGLWQRGGLLRLCSSLGAEFTLRNFPEHMSRLPTNHFLKHRQFPPQTQSETEDEEDDGYCDSASSASSFSSSYQGFSEEEDDFILPRDIGIYSTDSDHLPVPRRLRQTLDLLFFGRSDVSTEQPLSEVLSLQKRMNIHVHRHRFESETRDSEIAAILKMNRKQFGPKGPREINSEMLIREASLGETMNVRRILKDGTIHPDVSDARGHTALFAAAVNSHNDVIEVLLNSGADVDKLNDEGMSALAICHVLYYPFQSLHETVAERITPSISPQSQISPQRPVEDVSHVSSTDPITGTPKDESSGETCEKPRQTNQAEQSLESKSLDNEEKPEAPEIPGNAQLKEPEVLDHEPEQHGQDSTTTDIKSIQVYENRIPVGSVSWRVTKRRGDFEEKVLDHESDESAESDDPAFESARSLDGFDIDVTEDILQKSAEVMSHLGTVTPTDIQETVRKIAFLKKEHRDRWATITVLLKRGADPNTSVIPMPVLFLAIKAAHVEGVRLLLERGARTDVPLPPEQKGLYPLHVAAGLLGPEGVKITELLLIALADPDIKAQDGDEIYDQNAVYENKLVGFEPPAKSSGSYVAREGGRTPLHVACQRDCDHASARDLVALLLQHNASTDHVWSGHSALSLAITSGNELAVDELLAGGADPNLPLPSHVGSALCALANVSYDRGPQPVNRVKLLRKLIKAGAKVHMPVAVLERGRCAVGTVVDYAHYSFQQDKRLNNTSYLALSNTERQAYNAWKKLLTIMGDQLRLEAEQMEARIAEAESIGVNTAERPAIAGAVARPPRKPRYRFCYQCGRSVGVSLLVCRRCRDVFYCGKGCQTKSWNSRHKEECAAGLAFKRKNRDGLKVQDCLCSDKEAQGKPKKVNPCERPDTAENYSFI